MAQRLDTVTIRLSRETVELPWESRQALLDKMADLESMRSMRRVFEAVGASRPVELTTEQKGQLLEVIEFWAIEGGFAKLSPGVYELRNALLDDLYDKQKAD